MDQNLIHTSRTENVSHLSNPFHYKCRGNSSSLTPLGEPHSDRFRSPTPIFHWGGATRARARSIPVPARLRARLRTGPLRDHATLREIASAGHRSIRREDSPRSNRSLVAHFRASCFAGTEHDRIIRVAQHFRERA